MPTKEVRRTERPSLRREPSSLLSWRSAILFLAPLIVRGVAWLELRGDPFFRLLVVDARTYHEAASRLAAGGGRPDLPFWQPPLYPHLMGALYRVCGPDPDLVRWIQMVLGSIVCVLLFRLGARFFGLNAGWVAWGIATLYAPFIYFDLQLLNATLGLSLMLLALERVTAPGASRWAGAALGGLALGLAGITVASLLVILPVLWFVLFRRARGFKEACGRSERICSHARQSRWILFLIACALPVLGVTAWNWAGSGEAVVVSYNGGVNFWIGNNPQYDATVSLRPGRAWNELMQQPVKAGVTRLGETSAWWYREAWRWIEREPLAWGRLLLKKTRLLLRGDEIYRNQEIYPFRGRSVILRGLLWIFGPAFPFGFLLPLAGAGSVLLMAGRRGKLSGKPLEVNGRADHHADPTGWGSGSERSSAILLVTLATVLGLSVIAFFVTARYRLPIAPFLILLASGGCARAASSMARRDSRVVTLSAAVVFFVLFLSSNTGLPEMPSSFNSDTYFDMGTNLYSKGDMHGAALQYGKALELNPRNAEAAHNLGGVLLRMGHLDEADRCFSTVLALHPGDLNALQNLGAVAFYKGDMYKAGWLYTQAVRLNPGSAEARSDLEGLRGELRRREAAQLLTDPAALIDSLVTLVRARPDNEFLLLRISELTERK